MPASVPWDHRASLLGALLSSCTTTTLDPSDKGFTAPDGSAGASSDSSGGTPSGSAGASNAPEPNGVELPPCEALPEGRLLCGRPLAFAAAAYDCSLRGGYLAEIDSAAENEAVALAAGQAVGTNVWLGGTRTVDFVWAWGTSSAIFWTGGSDGTPEDGVYVNWAPGEPNNRSTVSDEPEKCLALTLGGNDWNDRACSLELPYACELD